MNLKPLFFVITVLMCFGSLFGQAKRQEATRPFAPSLKSVADLVVTIRADGSMESRIRNGKGMAACPEISNLQDELLSNRLGLSETTQRRLENLSAAYLKEARTIGREQTMEQAMPEIRTLLEKTRNDALGLLSPEQRQLFDGIAKRNNQIMLGWPLVLDLAKNESDLAFDIVPKKQIQEIIDASKASIAEKTSEIELRAINEILDVFSIPQQKLIRNTLGEDLEKRLTPLEVLLAQVNALGVMSEVDIKDSFVSFTSGYRLSMSGELALFFGPPGGATELIQMLGASEQFYISPDQWNDFYSSDDSPFSRIRKKYEQDFQTIMSMKNSLAEDELNQRMLDCFKQCDDDLFAEFKSRLLPAQIDKVDAFLIRAEITKIGLLGSLCFGRLGVKIQASASQKQQCRSIAESLVLPLRQVIEDLALEIDERFGTLLDSKQREFLKEEVGAFDPKTLLGSCPNLLISERNR